MFGMVGNSLWHLVQQADIMSKGVLLVLFIMSIVCWTVFICKLILLRLRSKDLERIYQQLQSVRTAKELEPLASQHANTVAGRFIAQTVMILNSLLELQSDRVSRNAEIMQYHVDQAVDTLITQEEAYLPVLSTSAAVAPLLGLFGTVWGLVHAFLRISEKQAADITVVAPGIAEALMTTLAGLIVAIPALVMYNYLLVHLRRLESDIVKLGDRVSFILQHTLGG